MKASRLKDTGAGETGASNDKGLYNAWLDGESRDLDAALLIATARITVDLANLVPPVPGNTVVCSINGPLKISGF